VDHKDKLVPLRIIHEVPNYLHDHNNICTNNKVVNHTQREKPYVSNPVDEISKQWKQQKSWNYMNSLLFNSSNPTKPDEEWGEKQNKTKQMNDIRTLIPQQRLIRFNR
jgi:hypothetical protein